MVNKRLPRLVVFGDVRKRPVAEAIEQFRSFVSGKAQIVARYGIEGPASTCIGRARRAAVAESKTQTLKRCDFAVVFGGDGSIISTARSLSGIGLPVIGVNLGKLGFLAEFSVEELKGSFADVVAGRTSIEKRMMLRCEVWRGERRRFCSAAVNDVFITAGPPFRAIELKMSVDGEPLAGCVSDGVIVSTPTGSTAYNLSAGGPILAGELEAIVVTPLCPHSLSFRPIVISASSTVEIVGLQLNEGTTLSIDGQISLPLTGRDVVRVAREESVFLVVNNPARSQWDTLASKLSWAERPKYKKE